jgi:hypothetical protein
LRPLRQILKTDRKPDATGRRWDDTCRYFVHYLGWKAK